MKLYENYIYIVIYDKLYENYIYIVIYEKLYENYIYMKLYLYKTIHHYRGLFVLFRIYI